MRLHTLIAAVVLAGGGWLHAGPADDATDRAARLVKQLGHKEFERREAASRELDAIGEPALPALRAAAADPDPEVRERAGRIVRAVAARLRVAAGKKELARWEGEWQESGGQTLIVKGDRWLWTGKNGPFEIDKAAGQRIANVVTGETATRADLLVGDGTPAVKACRAIFRLDGDTLHYCGTYDATRPTEFKSTGRNYYVAWKRARHGPPAPVRPVEVRLESAVRPTDLPLPECPAAVRRVGLTVRPADGESGTLTLDPNAPGLDEFGDPAAGQQQKPAATLAVTLKLVKARKGRQLYELRGPKVASRLSLVVTENLAPVGHARLLVHGRGGEVRYAIDLFRFEDRFPPCHPGCFPAGTRVHVPDGKALIERVREGDLVTTVGADGKLSPAKVTGVFTTRNRLLEVRVEGRTLVTTETQPVGLAAGGFRAAGELKAGDRVWLVIGDERRAVAVKEVTAAGREAEVFNLILGTPTGFVAGDFLVRSKPPAHPQP
jgi:hypothetical protein